MTYLTSFGDQHFHRVPHTAAKVDRKDGETKARPYRKLTFVYLFTLGLLAIPTVVLPVLTGIVFLIN